MEYEKIRYHLDFRFGDYGWGLCNYMGDDNQVKEQKLIIVDDMEKYTKEFDFHIDNDTIIKEIENYKKWENETISLTLKCLIEILERNKYSLGDELYLDLSDSGTLLDEGNCRCYDVDKIENFYFNSEYDLIKFKFRDEDVIINLSDYYYEDDDDCDFLLGISGGYLCGNSNCIKDECSCWDGDGCLL